MREAIKLILDAKKTRTPIIGKAKYAEVFLEFERLCDEQEYAEPSNLNPFTDITEAFETAGMSVCGRQILFNKTVVGGCICAASFCKDVLERHLFEKKANKICDVLQLLNALQM